MLSTAWSLPRASSSPERLVWGACAPVRDCRVSVTCRKRCRSTLAPPLHLREERPGLPPRQGGPREAQRRQSRAGGEDDRRCGPAGPYGRWPPDLVGARRARAPRDGALGLLTAVARVGVSTRKEEWVDGDR